MLHSQGAGKSRRSNWDRHAVGLWKSFRRLSDLRIFAPAIQLSPGLIRFTEFILSDVQSSWAHFYLLILLWHHMVVANGKIQRQWKAITCRSNLAPSIQYCTIRFLRVQKSARCQSSAWWLFILFLTVWMIPYGSWAIITMMLGMAPCPPTMCLSSTLGLLNSNRYPNRRTGLLPEQLGDMCQLLWKDTSNCDNCMIILW